MVAGTLRTGALPFTRALAGRAVAALALPGLVTVAAGAAGCAGTTAVAGLGRPEGEGSALDTRQLRL
ncbi:hypothetical protein GMPD_33100 [Geomonas paludis]|uniref:Uncharacterized protein n=1 Tax=Geomonas paludis TaxID=2740185 RepID=A0A6V8MZ34_9BACT|nr:hypothetical protein GMPD_33100 [Geomonas paludis]